MLWYFYQKLLPANATQKLVHLINSLWKVETRTNIEFLISGPDNAIGFPGSENDTNFFGFVFPPIKFQKSLFDMSP